MHRRGPRPAVGAPSRRPRRAPAYPGHPLLPHRESSSAATVGNVRTARDVGKTAVMTMGGCQMENEAGPALVEAHAMEAEASFAATASAASPGGARSIRASAGN